VFIDRAPLSHAGSRRPVGGWSYYPPVSAWPEVAQPWQIGCGHRAASGRHRGAFDSRCTGIAAATRIEPIGTPSAGQSVQQRDPPYAVYGNSVGLDPHLSGQTSPALGSDWASPAPNCIRSNLPRARCTMVTKNRNGFAPRIVLRDKGVAAQI